MAVRPVIPATPEQDAEGYRFIALNKDQVAVVDASDYDEMSKWAWRAYWNPDTKSFYAVRTDDKSYMQRHLMGVSDRHTLVDHRDHDTLNNRRANLRIATHSQNSYNRRLRSDNKSGTPGVKWIERRQKWAATISVDHKAMWLGYFKDLEQAKAVRLSAVVKYHKDFGLQQREVA